MTSPTEHLVLDRIDIVEVVTRYAASIDLRQWDRFASCLDERVHVRLASVGAWTNSSREEAVEFARSTFEHYTATQHISANHQIEIQGRRAICLATLNATHYVEHAKGGETQRQIGYYRFGLEKTPDWRIVRLEQILLWQDGNQALFDDANRASSARLYG